MFVDRIKIHVWAGNGGNGCASLHRAKFKPKGGPDGGDGGKGGDVIFEVSPHTNDLRTFFYTPQQRAKNGMPGSSQQKTGKGGKSIITPVPPGTVIYQTNEGAKTEPDYDEDGIPIEAEKPTDDIDEMIQIADLTEIGQQFVLAKGGKGGKGNMNFKSSTNQAPTEFTHGEPGEQGTYFLELRRIADAGFVGFPNAGKSTLLGALSAAKPKVASYPFTTLRPMVGVVESEGYGRVTLADIPGLIEGAHKNVGLGHDFLRHITRCSLLLFVVDMAGSEERDPCEDIAKLRTEISLYDDLLAKRPWMVIANKMDLPEFEENLKNFKQRFPKVETLSISAEKGDGLEELRNHLQETIGNMAK
ncbi:GTPase ObgE [Verrucomicrobiales bacterium]|nr:GTPase ObgE [Verrucomicrobiales bacterium]MDB4468204.1 GTPase ObgE [Verrucomicrobiales bacterium]